jgi:DNA replication protein DnaC
MKSLSLLILMSILASASIVYAQDSRNLKSTPQTKNASVNDDLLKSLEKALAELESARKVNSLQREEIDALQAKIDALASLVEIEKQRAEEWKKASQERATANQLDSQRIALFEKSLEEFKAELLKVRAERDKARKQRSIFAVGGVIVGGLLVLLGQR